MITMPDSPCSPIPRLPSLYTAKITTIPMPNNRVRAASPTPTYAISSTAPVAHTQPAAAARYIRLLRQAQPLKCPSSDNMRSRSQPSKIASAGNSGSKEPAFRTGHSKEKTSTVIHQTWKKISRRISSIRLSQMPSFTALSANPVQGNRPSSNTRG